MSSTTSKQTQNVDDRFYPLFKNLTPGDGKFNIDISLRAALSKAISESGKDRSQIREELYKLTGVDLTIHTLNNWTAESKSKSSDNEDQNNNKRWGIPAEMLGAFCHITNDNRPLEIVLNKIGLKLMTFEEENALALAVMEEQKKQLAIEIRKRKALAKKKGMLNG